MKQKAKILFIEIAFFAIAFFLIYSCDPADNRLKITNNSNTNIYFFYSCDTSLNNLDLFKNGYYHNSKGDSTYVLSDQYIKKNSFQNIPERGFNAWKHYLNGCVNKKLYIYFFSDSIVNEYSNDEIKNNQLYEKRLMYTVDDLKQNNWTVTYP